MTKANNPPSANYLLFTPIDRNTGQRLEMRIISIDIPRGRRWTRIVEDAETGQRYRAWQKSCGLPDCLCDAYVESLEN